MTLFLQQKYQKLVAIINKIQRPFIAYSGGTDSSFLLGAAIKILGRNNVLGITATSNIYQKSELKTAKSILKRLHAKHLFIRNNVLKKSSFYLNSSDRCFHCKNELFKKLSGLAKAKNMILCDATNFSDKNDYRPGMKAIKKWKVRSPLFEAGLTKPEIRKLSKKLGLPTWNAPAQACLASRFPYGTKITKHDLNRIEKGELFLQKLGFKNIRIRHHERIARIEIDQQKLANILDKSIRDKIANYLKKLGWIYITLDIEGYRCGSLNIIK
jgi:uncharacterized protein